MDQIIAFLQSPVGRVVLYVAVGLFGMFCHFLKKWADGEIEGSFWGYFFLDSGRRTVLALFAFGAVAVTELGTSLLNGMNLLAIAVMAWKSGYFSDTLNKGKAPAPKLADAGSKP